MDHLHQVLASKVGEWRVAGYPSGDASLFEARITDWRAMVDSVMIDPEYDGQALEVALYDVPDSKNDLVEGAYEFEAPDACRAVTVAGKITDMLGEEVHVTKELGSAAG